jgi:ABC-type glycerol-3-phosphate transport system permease component
MTEKEVIDNQQTLLVVNEGTFVFLWQYASLYLALIFTKKHKNEPVRDTFTLPLGSKTAGGTRQGLTNFVHLLACIVN